MLLERLARRAAAILIVCLIGTNVSYVAAQPNPAPGKSQLGGWVYIDRNNDGVLNFSTHVTPEWMISNVEVKLYLDGVQIDSDFTDDSGRYFFPTLLPGNYALEQVQPVQYVDGIDTVGKQIAFPSGNILPSATVDTSVNNRFSNIVLPANVRGDYFNFGERGWALGYASKRFLEGYEPIMEFGDDAPAFVIPEPATLWLATTAVGFCLLPRRRRRSEVRKNSAEN